MALRSTLESIATDLAHAWHPEAAELFRELGGAPGEPPPAVLARLSPAELDAASASGLGERAERLWAQIQAEAHGPGWWQAAHPDQDGFLCAYFSAEFGITDALPIFAGGLGVLAGDHLKAAAELRVPLVAVGLWYSGGYFQQGVSADGWQTEAYPRSEPDRLPVQEATTPAGEPLRVAVELPNEQVWARAWKARIGAVELYLLDTDIEVNRPAGRAITGALYAGDRELRIRQEVLLGVGGVRALRALGLAPTVFHMNEGHSAFLALERAREIVERGAEVEEAFRRVRPSTVFTTHTPAPAGNEVFERGLVDVYVRALVDAPLADAFLGLGSIPGDEGNFGMTPLALRTSERANGVSALHGEVARDMWAGLHDNGAAPAPIGHVTNGVHPRSWLSPALAERVAALGVDPGAPPAEARWERAGELSDEVLWELHVERKRALLDEVRHRHGGAALRDDALTIGFARRFATYKRATLLFALGDRLQRLLADDERPVQILFAGKAHPADDAGKALIQEVLRTAGDPWSAGRVVFLPGYDMALAGLLVQGCDVWLNTPRRPLEASGTSGMKAALNGVLNASILDGWWDEAFTPELGFAIGGRGAVGDEQAQDAADVDALGAVLSEQVVPSFFERDADGLPRAWLAMMRTAIATTGAHFSSQRMVVDYVDRFYLPAHAAGVERVAS